MKPARQLRAQKTTVGEIDREVLAFTVGRDLELDLELVEADAIGSAAHAAMLAGLPGKARILSAADLRKVRAALSGIVARARRGAFRITLADQDVHMAVERELTAALGDLGRRIHAGRSRNDQVAVDLRLHARVQILHLLAECLDVADALGALAWRSRKVPMAGRTHMQPAMPSTVGLWAGSHAEALLDDAVLLINAYEFNNQSPLGSAAGFGVPLPIRPELTAKWLGFDRAIPNALYASSARGKVESVILAAAAQAMVSLSRLAQDLMIYTMPEFGYFSLPAGFCTGSSIMPQKRNPDVLELVRAKAATVAAAAAGVLEILRGLPGGYNRDLQEIKGPFLDSLRTTRASVGVMARLVRGIEVHERALRAGFGADVFATDWALELVAGGMPFRDAYHHVKAHLDECRGRDPRAAALRKTHLGAPGGLDFAGQRARIRAGRDFVRRERRDHARVVGRLLG